MPLTVHHMERSQSERVVWLCEELGIQYTLKTYPRNEVGLAPEIFKKLHRAGTAPVVEDDTAQGEHVVIGESGAVVEYIEKVHGGGKLSPSPADGKKYADYLGWFHFANASLQATFGREMLLSRLGEQARESPFAGFVHGKRSTALGMYDEHLASNKWLLGDEFSAADVMSVFTFTTMRGFAPVDLSPYPNILRYLKDVGGRPAYRSAMQKGDPHMKPMLEAVVEPFDFKGPQK